MKKNRFTALATIYIGNHIFDIVKGSRLTKQDMKDGDIRYVGATAFNNGITNHIGNDENIHPAGTLTVCYNGSIGQTYYQDKEFWATDDVNVLYPKFPMNKHIALFIAPLIKSVGRNYAYTDKWKMEDMKSSIVYLPIKENSQPDWAYMEQYMKTIEKQVRMSIDKLINVTEGKCKRFSINTWKNFVIGDYFNAINTGNILSRDIVEGSGSTPFVTASGVNNGVVAYMDASNYDIIKGECILIGGKTFTLTYQKEDFVSNDSHNIALYSKGRVMTNFSLYYYCLEATLQSKYHWGDAVTKDKLLAQTIKLPNNKDGGPDWDYMRDYMQPFKSRSLLPLFYETVHILPLLR